MAVFNNHHIKTATIYKFFSSVSKKVYFLYKFYTIIKFIINNQFYK